MESSLFLGKNRKHLYMPRCFLFFCIIRITQIIDFLEECSLKVWLTDSNLLAQYFYIRALQTCFHLQKLPILERCLLNDTFKETLQETEY